MSIYIPLCLYFNKGTTENSIGARKFTFHYVSILMRESRNLPRALKQFTFHYVSILITSSQTFDKSRALFTFHYVSILIPIPLLLPIIINIYIPLCLYFNPEPSSNLLAYTAFTFHYVSILI